jgi:hypothetical protein
MAISNDHSRIYVAGIGLWVFDAASGKLLAHNQDSHIATVTTGSNGVVVAGRTDGTVGRFDPDTLVEVSSVPGSGPPLVSDDGSIMMGRDGEGAVSLVDLGSGERLGDPIATTSSACGCSFDIALRGDGLQAATTGPDGTGVVLWDLDPEHWVTAACIIGGRNLTNQEWATYIGDLGDYRATCPEYQAGI